MLGTLHNHAIVVVVDKLEGSGRRVAHRTGAHIHRAWCQADSPSPQKGRRWPLRAGRWRCSPSFIWAASRATLAFPIVAVLTHM